MIEKLERQKVYGSPKADLEEVADKLNEVIDYLNAQQELASIPILKLEGLKKVYDMLDIVNQSEPKWKVGDRIWYIRPTGTNTNYWVVEDCILEELEAIKENDLNYFKTKAQAEAALAEIKQVMEKYQ